jgi:hypothetical protein
LEDHSAGDSEHHNCRSDGAGHDLVHGLWPHRPLKATRRVEMTRRLEEKHVFFCFCSLLCQQNDIFFADLAIFWINFRNFAAIK